MTDTPAHSRPKILLFTALALIAFAANSVLCRLALGTASIDAASFTAVRLLSGALMLYVLLVLGGSARAPGAHQGGGSWAAGALLFLYAICFSFAYLSLDTGTGALILFGSVQISMIVLSLLGGQRLRAREWLGIVIAFGGLVYLVSPGVSAPSWSGFLLMATAGIAWGGYTLKGRASRDPLRDTTYNFIRSVPWVLIAFAAALFIGGARFLHASATGVVLAVLSGAIASGIGYTIWYLALRGLGATQAAVVQLSVPVIAALGGVLFVGEAVTQRLMIATLLILGGILLVIVTHRRSGAVPQEKA